jgi:protein involved in polysaccharide export with SLBB domain
MRATGWLALCLVAFPAAAQQPGPALATRERLREELARLERDGGSRAEVELIRTRLDNGDFQAGDRILVRVEGEQALSDTFTVGPGPELVLPQIGAVPLGGVLRSELKSRLETHLAQYFREPAVQVRSLVRILVDGSVAKPGFYAVPPELPLADVLGVAGGLAPQAKVSEMRVERGRDKLWSGELLQQALGRGSSLDQLSLRAGDRVFVPAGRDSERTIRLLGILVTIPVALYTLTQIF